MIALNGDDSSDGHLRLLSTNFRISFIWSFSANAVFEMCVGKSEMSILITQMKQ